MNENVVHQQRELPNPNQQNDPAGSRNDRVKIDFYTDPLCCWSWAFEKSWRQLLKKYGDQISYSYVLCGMIPDWNSYNDAMNFVSRPLQMGPVWMHASEVTGTPMRYDIWHLDPPSSSFPSCIAVKTAGLQSTDVAEKYLTELRRCLMEDAANISREKILLSVAKRIDGLDFEKFRHDWINGLGKNSFREDLQKAKLNGVGRFPTLTFTRSDSKGIIIVGYRPFDVLEQAFESVRICDQ